MAAGPLTAECGRCMLYSILDKFGRERITPVSLLDGDRSPKERLGSVSSILVKTQHELFHAMRRGPDPGSHHLETESAPTVPP